jgi:TonB-linked SusC/RagA family outer membrane protein
MKKNSSVLKRVLFVVLALSLYTVAWAQSRTITGVVKDATGESIIGASVLVKGTNIGTITNFSGAYTLSVPESAKILVFSYVGLETKEIAITGLVLNVTLADDSRGLDELVVVGYGVVRKRDLTGSVSSIKSDDITKTTTSNPLQAMQAKVPGLEISQSDGQAGSKININLRGSRSISASNSPLILVDGIDYGSTIDINPSDIESMEVLKDASSTAIYGSRGANGVIIITTKRGKAGKTQVNFSTFMSSNQATNIPKVMYGDKEVQRLIDKANYQADVASGNWGSSNKTVEQTLTESYADFTEIAIYNDKSYTDWADILLQGGQTKNYELSVSGGNEKTTFNLSLGAMNEGGLLKNDALDRYNGRVNIDHKINNYVKTGASMLFTYKDHEARNASVFTQALKMTTITHPYTQDGEIIDTPNPRYLAHANPLFDEVDGAISNNTKTTRFFGNGFVEVTPVKNLIFKSMFALDQSNARYGLYQDYKSVGRFQSPGSSFIASQYSRSTGFTWDNTLNYNTNLGNPLHDLTFLVGSSMKQDVNELNRIEGDAGKEHYYSSTYYDVKKIITPVISSNYIKSSMLSYFGRLNYKFNERYLFSASVRADGSSTLSEGNKWGYFPSLAAAWRMNEESFLQNADWLDNLKVRASWGVSGNAAVDPYMTLTTLSIEPLYYYLGGVDVPGKIPSKMGNNDLVWETTRATNFGIDFAILDNRISGSVDYYISNTSDLLYMRSAPPSSVFPSVIDNIGETKGSGIEVALNTAVVKTRDFNWDINWSYSSSKDEIVALSDGLQKNINGRTGQIVGQPLNIFYNYQADGVWNVGEFDTYKTDWEARHPGETLGFVSAYGAPGTIKLLDADDDGKLTDEDKMVYDRSPKHIFGMNNSFSYKNFSLDVLVYARIGGYIEYDMNSQLNFETANWGDLDYWTPTNTGARFPSPGSLSTTWGSYGTALLYEKADFIKIKDITLGYKLPKSLLDKVGLSSVKLYGSLKNYFTFSSIENYDPERGGSINFPLAKQVVVGLNVQL